MAAFKANGSRADCLLKECSNDASSDTKDLQSYNGLAKFFFPGLDGLPLPTTPSTKKARAGQLNKKDQIAESLKVPVFINAAHLRRGIRGAMRDG